MGVLAVVLIGTGVAVIPLAAVFYLSSVMDAYIEGEIWGYGRPMEGYRNDRTSKWEAYWYDKGYTKGQRRYAADNSLNTKEIIQHNKEKYEKRG